MWKMLMIAVIFANGNYHTMYFQISHPQGGEWTFPDEQTCLDQVDSVSHSAQTREWSPGRKTQALPVSAVCLPGTLADFVRVNATPKIPNSQVGQVQIPPNVLTEYVPPKPTGPPPAQPQPPAAPGGAAAPKKQ